MTILNPLRDPGQASVVRECARCGAEIYGGDSELCTECLEEIKGTDILVKYAEAWPKRFFKFLGDQKDEGYMKELWTAMRECCESADDDGPDLEGWIVS